MKKKLPPQIIYTTEEDAIASLHGWQRLRDKVYGFRSKRAYVAFFRNPVEEQHMGRPAKAKTNEGWIVSFWPIDTVQGRKKRDEMGGEAWM